MQSSCDPSWHSRHSDLQLKRALKLGKLPSLSIYTAATCRLTIIFSVSVPLSIPNPFLKRGDFGRLCGFVEAHETVWASGSSTGMIKIFL